MAKMKKLFFFLILIFLLSCEKAPIDCWVCKVDSITTVQGVIVGTMSTLTYPCGLSTEEIFCYEEHGTRTETIAMLQTGYIIIRDITTASKTNCKRK